jgi:hypothetical protein
MHAVAWGGMFQSVMHLLPVHHAEDESCDETESGTAFIFRLNAISARSEAIAPGNGVGLASAIAVVATKSMTGTKAPLMIFSLNDIVEPFVLTVKGKH